MRDERRGRRKAQSVRRTFVKTVVRGSVKIRAIFPCVSLMQSPLSAGAPMRLDGMADVLV